MVKMSIKLYKVWWALLDHPGEWMDASDLSQYTDLTSRQVVSLMAEVTSPLVRMELTDIRPRRQICFEGTIEQAEDIRRDLMIWRYNISEHHIQGVYDAMSSAGWTTISDISEETGMSKANVSKVLKCMRPDEIYSKPSGTSTLYRRA